jgi:hypothetical protein
MKLLLWITTAVSSPNHIAPPDLPHDSKFRVVSSNAEDGFEVLSLSRLNGTCSISSMAQRDDQTLLPEIVKAFARKIDL